MCLRRRFHGLREFLPVIRRVFRLHQGFQGVADAAQDQREGEELRFRKAGNQGEEENEAGGDQERLGLGENLPADLRADIARVRAGTGHQDAGGNGDEERGNLGDQPVADGQDAIELQGLARADAILRDADQCAAQDVDHRHDDPGDGVALDEFHRPVHRPEHLAFLGDLLAAALRFFHVDGARPEIGVDGHLLAGHGVQGEARADFGNPLGALGDHQELDDGEDDEHHRADDEITAHRELAEGEDDLPGVGLEENQAGGGDVETHAKERGEKEHGGKGGKLERPLHVHAHHQHDEGKRHVGPDQGVDHRGGQRHDHQGDDGDGERD